MDRSPSIPDLSTSESLPDDTVTYYTIIVRGEEFQLSYGHISCDSPNFFTDCFRSGFVESREHVLRLDRNPVLFALIVEYLSGYPILPPTTDSLPSSIGITMARRCLLADAQFYGLQMLSRRLSTCEPSLDMTQLLSGLLLENP